MFEHVTIFSSQSFVHAYLVHIGVFIFFHKFFLFLQEALAWVLFKEDIKSQSFHTRYTRFTKLKPGNVRKISATFLDTCQCVYCVNVRLKVLAINRSITRHGLDPSLKLDDERSVVNMLLCAKKPGEAFHKPQGIQGVYRVWERWSK